MIGTKIIPERLARCVRPLHSEYITVGDIIGRYHVYSMTRKEFIGLCMRNSGNPLRYSKIYDMLMDEAGLPPLEDEQ